MHALVFLPHLAQFVVGSLKLQKCQEQQDGPCPNVEGKYRLDDFGNLGSKRETLFVALKQQIELQRKLYHGLSHGGKFCRHYHHPQHDGHHISRYMADGAPRGLTEDWQTKPVLEAYLIFVIKKGQTKGTRGNGIKPIYSMRDWALERIS